MVSNRCYYALLATLELSLRRSQAPVTTGEIAEVRHIPARFLAGIMRQLKQAGIVASVRGKEGGYYLARDARQITVGDIIRTVEDPHSMPGGTDLQAYKGVIPGVLDPLWADAEAALFRVYDSVHFGLLAEREQQHREVLALDYAI